jgi:hypothetical protein
VPKSNGLVTKVIEDFPCVFFPILIKMDACTTRLVQKWPGRLYVFPIICLVSCSKCATGKNLGKPTSA